MRTFNSFISLVRQWANRDEEVLSDAIVIDCMDYAIDKAYRELRIPELETTVSYSSAELEDATTSGNGTSITELSVPSDLLEFIQIRGVDADGVTTRVFNERTDIRTFYDPYSEKYSRLAHWARIGDTIVFSPGYSTEDVEDSIYLHYYRELGALDERYDVTAVNANLDISYLNNGTPPSDLRNGGTVPTAILKKATYTFDGDGSVVDVVFYENTVADGSIPAADPGYTLTITADTYYGELKPNWFRDNNHRILLNGALSQVFTYLNEPDTAQMYYQIFLNEIQELNTAELRKKTSGGNIQINVNGWGLI